MHKKEIKKIDCNLPIKFIDKYHAHQYLLFLYLPFSLIALLINENYKLNNFMGFMNEL